MVDSTETRVKRVIAEALGIQFEQMQLSDSLLTDYEADSVELVGILMDIEDEFEILVPNEVFTTFSTVQAIVDYLHSQNL